MMALVHSFEAVHRAYQAKLVRYFTGFVGADEAADLAQVTMMKVSEHLPGFRGESSLSTWIYRIAASVPREIAPYPFASPPRPKE